MPNLRPHVTTGTRRPRTIEVHQSITPPPLQSHDRRALIVRAVTDNVDEAARLVREHLRRSPRREQLLADLARVPALVTTLYDHPDRPQED